MREIKFRAWDIEEKYMFPVDTLAFPVGGVSVYGPGVGSGWSKVNGNHHRETIILEQFTGLHDKNGKEIYEGDIVRANGMSNTHSWDSYINKALPNRNTRIVTWIENGWALVEPVLNRVTQGITLKTGTQKRFEVIGNIHENPELING